MPLDAPGVKVVRMLPVFGYDDAPHGHAEVILDNVRVAGREYCFSAKAAVSRSARAASGRAASITACAPSASPSARSRRCANASLSREAFGKKIADHSVWEQRVAEARTEIEMCRLLTLKAAYMMDTVGNKVARTEIAMIKVAAPRMALKVIDDAIQAHGGGGVTSDFGLARMYSGIRTLRLADGPDEVHNRTIARLEFKKYMNKARAAAERS